MAVTKILARHGGLRAAIAYVTNSEKTQEYILAASQDCTIDTAYQVMMGTKRRYDKEDGVQLYHIIPSFNPGEVTPEVALEIAQEFVALYIHYLYVLGKIGQRQYPSG